MSKVLLINPNTSAAMTDRVLRIARASHGHTMQFEALTAQRGVSVVASRASYVVAAQSVLEIWAASSRKFDAIVVACFGDPGVAALRELTQIPVYGLAQSAIAAAQADTEGFAIVTAGPAWKLMLDELVQTWGHFATYKGTYAINATGMGAAEDPRRFRTMIQTAIDTTQAKRVGTVVLGGAALAGTKGEYRSVARLIDPLQATLDSVLASGMLATDAGTDRPEVPQLASVGLDHALARLLMRE